MTHCKNYYCISIIEYMMFLAVKHAVYQFIQMGIIAACLTCFLLIEMEGVNTMTSETRMRVFARDGYRCRICHCPVTLSNGQAAHIVANTKANCKKYGKAAIDHPDNLMTACSLTCNAKAMKGAKGLIEREHMQKIIDKIDGL